MRLWLCLLLTACLVRAQINPERADLRVLVLGDFNGPYGSVSYPPDLSRVLGAGLHIWKPDLLVSAGDVIAGQQSALPDERFTEMWSAFDAAVAGPLRGAGIPYAVALGNHDGSSAASANGTFLFERERAAAQTYWRQLQHDQLAFQSRDDLPFNYSFVFNGVFFAVWDASSAVITNNQRDWLASELKSPAARDTALRVLVGHLPLYGVGEGKNELGEVLDDASELRALLDRLEVNLYISGHHAAYYPARVGPLALLHAGGVGARRLVGDDASPRSTVTLLDISLSSGDFRLTTFDVTTFELVTLQSLPERLDGLNGPLWRIDKAPYTP